MLTSNTLCLQRSKVKFADGISFGLFLLNKVFVVLKELSEENFANFL